MPRIITAKSAGFCGGVRRAVNMAMSAAKENKNTYILGELVHNKTVCKELENAGVQQIDDISKLKQGDTLILRSHGVPKCIYDQLQKAGINYIDTTCGFVKKIHKIAAEQTPDTILIIAGEKTHPEVLGIAGHASCPVMYIKSLKDVENLLTINSEIKQKKLCLVAQTTFNLQEFEKIKDFFKKLYTNISIYDTICTATSIRQNEVAELAPKCDLMVIIGGKNSSNTKKLYEISSELCSSVCIEEASQLAQIHIHENAIVGITAGASTPDCIIKEVQTSMENLDNITNDMSFEEMLMASTQQSTIRNGDRVEAVVVKVKPNEVIVDCGVKHGCYVPLSELTDNPALSAEDVVKEGDKVILVAVRVNDVEGTIMFSKRRVDAAKNFDEIMNGAETGNVFTGRVADVVNGGVLVSAGGVKVFIPASQSGVPKNEDLASIKGKTVNFKILETNRAKRRAVGSISLVAREQRELVSKEFWENVQIGKKYEGTVRNITNFGVFVDLGGVDGRISLSDLTWQRVRHPSEVVSVGDKLVVTVKDITEDKKISLIYKDLSENPWEKILSEYSVGDVVEAKIVSITTFGAFANIIPGIDGLIHISQISKDRVENVEDVLHVGDVIKAMLTEIDADKHRASLSIRALEEKADAERAPIEYSTDAN